MWHNVLNTLYSIEKHNESNSRLLCFELVIALSPQIKVNFFIIFYLTYFYLFIKTISQIGVYCELGYEMDWIGPCTEGDHRLKWTIWSSSTKGDRGPYCIVDKSGP